MKRSESFVRRLMPRREFTESELALVDTIYSALFGGDDRKGRLPSRFTEVGDVLEYEGYRYLCVERDCVSHPSDACRGCDFALRYRGCDKVQCSMWDRRDGLDVWFSEIGKINKDED